MTEEEFTAAADDALRAAQRVLGALIAFRALSSGGPGSLLALAAMSRVCCEVETFGGHLALISAAQRAACEARALDVLRNAEPAGHA